MTLKDRDSRTPSTQEILSVCSGKFLQSPEGKDVTQRFLKDIGGICTRPFSFEDEVDTMRSRKPEPSDNVNADQGIHILLVKILF